MGFSVVSVAFVVMNKSVQQLMDERMCRPGYRWNPTLKRCLGMGGPISDPGLDDLPEFDTPEPPPEMETPAPPPQAQAPAKPPAQKGKSSRSVKRVNPNGIVQTGTQMGLKGMPLKLIK